MKNISQYSLCISDLMMGLLFVFILILMKFMLQYEDKKEELSEPLSIRAELLQDLKKEIKNKNKSIEVKIDTENGTLKLTGISCFNSGKWTLGNKGKENFKTLREIFLNKLLCYSDIEKTKERKRRIAKNNNKNLRNEKKGIPIVYLEKKCKNKKNTEKSIDSILIEGHADSTPIGENLKFDEGIETNMDLAMKRSQTIFKLLTDYEEESVHHGEFLFYKESLHYKEKGNLLHYLSNIEGKPLFGVTSYGSLRGDVKEENSRGPASKKQDRCIDIRFIMAQPENLKKELQKIPLSSKKNQSYKRR